jgi:Protein of unknown function (DUF2490)
VSCARRASALLAASLVACGGRVCADTTTEFWPELRLWIPLDEDAAWRALLTTSGIRDRDTGQRIEAQGAGYIDYRLDKNISFRTGYSYADDKSASTGKTTVDRIFNFAFTYTWHPGDHTIIANRARIDAGNDGGTSYQRYRDRLRIEHQLPVFGHEFSPYGQLEAYYDSRYDTVNRYRLEVGSLTHIGRHVELDTYFGRQRDTAPSLKYTNGIGLTINVYL